MGTAIMPRHRHYPSCAHKTLPMDKEWQETKKQNNDRRFENLKKELDDEG